LDGSSCRATLSDLNYAPTYGGTFSVLSASITVTVTGSQTYDGAASFSASTNVAAVTATNASCTTTTAETITPTLAVGSYTLDGSTCSASLSDPNYTPTYVGSAFAVSPAPITVTVTGSQTYGGSPTFTAVTDVAGVTASAASCRRCRPGRRSSRVGRRGLRTGCVDV
jgi:hypothetical protein